MQKYCKQGTEKVTEGGTMSTEGTVNTYGAL